MDGKCIIGFFPCFTFYKACLSPLSIFLSFALGVPWLSRPPPQGPEQRNEFVCVTLQHSICAAPHKIDECHHFSSLPSPPSTRFCFLAPLPLYLSASLPLCLSPPPFPSPCALPLHHFTPFSLFPTPALHVSPLSTDSLSAFPFLGGEQTQAPPAPVSSSERCGACAVLSPTIKRVLQT